MLKSFRYLLLPFSFIYGALIWIRNWLYDKNYLKSVRFNFPLICVGNIAVGGTGKTPMVEYLIEFLNHDFKIATLSRGYKRKTTGFAIADKYTTALEIGDEPMQFHQKFPDIIVAVGEERLVAIPQLLQEKPDTEVIILDDAFQHRAVNAGLNIVLTEYKNLYPRDLMMPAGDLRDVKASMKRADVIVVTKCKKELDENEKNDILKEIKPTKKQSVFFTCIEYTQPYHLFSKEKTNINYDNTVLLICGIANPKPLKEYFTDNVHSYDLLRYPDHHIFNIDDLEEIKKQFSQITQENKLIVTTEKDAVRLQKFETELKDFPIYILPIKHRFLFEQTDMFKIIITDFIYSFNK
ncbi:MAG: tetraacyldisaccharide 4'-kinase [Ferruginibacter sp.]